MRYEPSLYRAIARLRALTAQDITVRSDARVDGRPDGAYVQATIGHAPVWIWIADDSTQENRS